MGTSPTTNGSSSQVTTSQGANRPSWQAADPQEWIHLCPQLCANQQAQKQLDPP